ncbi:hypothetical protein [Amycolatopsis albispora]|uniref:Excreted virulence factor EspC (Type VII ESX diderm) n=1 Tax=Amycolatopsis albispora TaxID=1804986 RepID=A0A344L328_9PSEU|nr:hypothetical protein [Amycolatopsis albispora]AXB42452.1 hypothetical protein A4R43_07855 [Amycolatopsis albispora]
MGFEVHVRDLARAADRLAAAESPALDAQGAPRVGGTDGAAGYAADYQVWLETRRLDLKAADQQTAAIVAKIKAAAEAYDTKDADARDAFVKAIDDGFAQIDR